MKFRGFFLFPMLNYRIDNSERDCFVSLKVLLASVIFISWQLEGRERKKLKLFFNNSSSLSDEFMCHFSSAAK